MKRERNKTEEAVQKPKKKRPSTKGALIKGMSRRLPSVILGNPMFEKRLKEIMKRYAGIYALYCQRRRQNASKSPG
jgi:hypothetical protein